MKRNENGFVILTKKSKNKKSKKYIDSYHDLDCDFDTAEDEVPFFTEEDYDPATLKVNIHKDFTIERPKPKKKKKTYQGATFEAGRKGFKLRIFFG